MARELASSASHFLLKITSDILDEFKFMKGQQPNQETTDECEAFVCWFTSQLLGLFTHPGCKQLHSQCVDLIVQFLNRLKLNEPYLYMKNLEKLAQCLRELAVSEYSSLESMETEKSVVLNLFNVDLRLISKFLPPPEQNTEIRQAVLKLDSDSCDTLQGYLTKVFSQQVRYMNGTWNAQLLTLLSPSLLSQIEYGDIPLKVASLQVMEQLLLLHGLPEFEILEYLVAVLVAIPPMLYDNQEQLTPEEASSLETAYVKTLNAVRKADSLRLGNHLDISNLDLMLNKFVEFMSLPGWLLKLQKEPSVDICAAVSSFLNHILKKLKQIPCLFDSVYVPIVNVLKEKLCHLVGKVLNKQLLVQNLCLLIVWEIESCSNNNNNNSSNSETSLSKDIEEPQPKKAKLPYLPRLRNKSSLSNNKRKITAGDKSKLFQEIKQKLDVFRSNSYNDSNEVICMLTGVQIILEISVLLFHYFKDNSVLMTNTGRSSSEEKLTVWLSKDELTQMSVLWKNLFSLFITPHNIEEAKIKELLNVSLQLIARSVAVLLIVKDFGAIMPELVSDSVALLSLPWLASNSSWLDLHSADLKAMVELSSRLSPAIEDATSQLCVEVLCWVPKYIAGQWRYHVYKSVLANNLNLAFISKAVYSSVIFLHSLEDNYIHLIQELILPLFRLNDPAIDHSLASVFGELVCVLSGETEILQSGLFEPNKDQVKIFEVFKLKCKQCDNPKNMDNSLICRKKFPIIQELFACYYGRNDMSLDNNNNNAKYRKALARSLFRVYNHVRINPNDDWTLKLLHYSLQLINDPDYDVAILFSKCCGGLIKVSGVDIANIVFNKLKTSLYQLKDTKNVNLQKSILTTVGLLGKYSTGQLLLDITLFLLENIVSDVPIPSAVAYMQLLEVSRTKKSGENPFNIFMNYQQPICLFLVKTMDESCKANSGKSAEQKLKEVSNVFDYEDIKAFIHSTERFLLPQLVAMASPNASALIKILATLLFVPSRKKLLISSTKHIFSYLIRHLDEKEMERALQFHFSETEIELTYLLRIDFQRVHNELLLHLSSNYAKVFKGLQLLCSYDESYGGQIVTATDMANYLQPRLLGILAFFDSQLLICSIPIEEKKLTLESLTSIIQLMGIKHVTFVRYKIMNTLRISLRFHEKDILSIACRAWKSFVRSVELSALGDMLSPISATLLPLIQQLPSQSAEIFDYLIVENKATLCSHFQEIYFLPDIPELSNVNSVLKQYSSSLSSQSDLRTKITHALRGVTHESSDVQIHALSNLKNLLHCSQRQLHQYMLDNETADPIVSRLISVLLSVCKVPDQRVRCLIGDCFGEIGAIDPGRLELTSNNPKEDMAKFQASTEDDNFAIGLINEIIRAFLAATETRVQDCAALALQDLMQIYKISNKPEENCGRVSRSRSLWNRFPEHVQEILQPLLSSKYISSSTFNWENLQKPIFGSAKGSKYNEWICIWTTYLASQYQQSQPLHVFQVCSPITRYDSSIALYMLPHVVVEVLINGTEGDFRDIYNEIMEVLNQISKSDTRQGSVTDLRHMSAQTIFSVLDYLSKWRTNRAQLKAAEMPSSKEPVYLKDPGYKTVNAFLNQIPQDVLAEACFNCNAFTRALMHFEQFIRGNNCNIQQHLDLLQRIYIALDEHDGVAGVASIRQVQPTLVQQILAHQSIGQYQDAEACYERVVQLEPEEISHHHGWLRSLMELGQLNKALLHADGIIANHPSWSSQLNPYRVEATCKLGDWSHLESYIKLEKDNNNWVVGLGRILLAIKDREEESYQKHLNSACVEIMGPLSAASLESFSYLRGYECIVRLHMLNEIEQAKKIIFDSHLGARNPNRDFNSDLKDPQRLSDYVSLDELLLQWDARLKLMQCPFRIQEPVLTLRRTLLTLANRAQCSQQIGKWHLDTATVAREAGYLQTAYGSLIQAASSNLPEYCLEKAKWFWEKGQNDQAMSCLEKGMAEHFSNLNQLKRDTSEKAKKKLFAYAQAQLLYTHYCDETSNTDSNTVLKQYREVTDSCPEWEDGYFYLAKYYDKMKNNLIDDNENWVKQGEFNIFVVKNYGTSLQYGNQYIYQSLPRLLSLWLDYGSTVVQSELRDQSMSHAQKLQSQKTILHNLNKVIEQISRKLAPYQLFTAFSQLISRICHANSDVFRHLVKIIAKLLYTFPAQAVWMLMAVSKSSYPKRVKRCQEIFIQAKQMKEELGKFLLDANKLTERLLDLSERHCPDTQPLSLSQHFKSLKRLLDDPNFSNIIVPLQSSMTVTLPMMRTDEHDPFPGEPVYISSFEDTIEILPSLQKPKKITIKGSDGHLYVMMCKPKDDLRKDCRLMEFTTIVNKFLRKDPEARKRQLHIRAYTVIPLNEECGIIEWVNNTSGLQYILRKLYREKGLQISNRELKSHIPLLQAPLERKLELFKMLLALHPSVFHEWFLRTFPDPTAWYNARLAYARTSAVMDMVGYILGLGDRHGENILMDSTTGDCVHVDFNCLFNKGETFEWPEKVPFRLTNNMVDAMGPMGYEGIFRQACEVTLKVLRTQMDPLMSVLKPFIYDPLVEWQKSTKGQRSHQVSSGEISNEQAMTHVQMIEHRMRGVHASKTKPRGLPLSVEGQVNYLIHEATNEKLLCQMYIGWAPYL
ncbi:serine/threonine-protein kinase ATR-like [Argonauta hians]